MLAMLADEVVSCEIHQPLAELATRNISAHGINNATVLNLNGMDAELTNEAAELKQPFDVIILTAAIEEIPAHIASMLNNGGQIMAFIGRNPVVSLIRQRKIGQTWQETGIFETLLLDMEGLAPKREFIF